MKWIIANMAKRLLSLGCIVAFGSTIALAFMDKPASATIAGSMTLAFLVFIFLPMMENFEVWGLKAKLRDQVGEAQELIEQLRSHVGISSKMMLHQLAYSDRLASPSWQTKADFLRSIEDNLSTHAFRPADVSIMKEPILHFLVIDHLHLAAMAIGERVNFRLGEIGQEFSKAFPGGTHVNDLTSSEYQALDQKRKALNTNVMPSERTLSLGLPDRPSKMVRRMMTDSGLPADDGDRLFEALAELMEIADEVISEDTITPRSIAFLDRFAEPTDWQKLYLAAFPEAARE